MAKWIGDTLLANALNLIHPNLVLKLYNAVKPAPSKYTNLKDKYIKLRNVLKAKDVMERYDLAVSYFLEEDLKLLGIEPSEKKNLKD